MIFDISDSMFRRIFDDENLHLPIQWNGNDFYLCLEVLFNKYFKNIKSELVDSRDDNDNHNFLDFPIKQVCSLIKSSVKHYLDGFPAQAYESLDILMGLLQQRPLRVYKKSCFELLEGYNDKLNLFRVAKVDDNIPYARTRIFHTPYNLRSKVSTSRYSIAGYPSLYLGTSLELCCEEIQYNPHNEFAIASKFKIERSIKFNDTEISVIELALKPQDFFNRENDSGINRRRFNVIDLSDAKIKKAYLLWYPLIAACSFIRTNKSHPFAVEYIIPQLLMQWVRLEMERKHYHDYDQLIGIRYFSCASKRASDMGFNYVFPVSGNQTSPQFPYCPVLSRAFKLTKPHFINEYYDIKDCERSLIYDKNLDFVGK
ncbi:MAG: hypothetical protein SO434_02880 [Eubacteriales bacterium]|nr:hypothetical protein [Eubacteriales bacterium]